jgi:hypothetical protein
LCRPNLLFDEERKKKRYVLRAMFTVPFLTPHFKLQVQVQLNWKPHPNQKTKNTPPTTHACKMKLHTHFILGLLLFANYCIKKAYPASAASPSLSNPSSTTVFEGEEWRRHLPEKLSNRNGAPLHKIIIESTSNPVKNVTVYLLGTSHVSRTSCEDAKLLMEHARPGETHEFVFMQ